MLVEGHIDKQIHKDSYTWAGGMREKESRETNRHTGRQDNSVTAKAGAQKDWQGQ